MWRSFIIKRIPVLVKQFVPEASAVNGVASSDAVTPSMDEVVCQPLRMLDRGTVNLLRISGGGDELDEMFSSFPSTTSDVRHEFLQACVDLELVTPAAVGRALGEEVSSIVRNGRSKEADTHGRAGSNMILVGGTSSAVTIDELFSKVAAERPDSTPYSQSLLTWLVSIYEDLDGIRQATIASSIVRFVERCVSISNLELLARLAQALGARGSVFDHLFLHINPLRFLNPFVTVLDNWNDKSGNEDVDNDLQGVNTAFGSILLMIALVFKRYRMRKEDFEVIDKQNSFAVNIVSQHPGNYLLIDDSELSDEQRDLIGGWISALYDTGGISDDLMKSIHNLIPIVPPIFQQSIAALEANVVDLDTVKSGLDYFLQPFLLPTLLVGVRFLCRYLAKSAAGEGESSSTSATLQIMQHIINAPLGDETATVLRDTVLNVVGDELHYALRDLDRSRIASKEVLVILDTLTATTQPYYAASVGAVIGDEPGNMVVSLRDQMASLVDWAQAVAAGHANGPPTYNPSLVSVGVRILGASMVLSTLIESAVATSGGTNAPVYETALDVVATLVIVSSSCLLSSRSRTTLQDSSLMDLISTPTASRGEAAEATMENLVMRVRAIMEKIHSGMDAAATMEEANAMAEPTAAVAAVDDDAMVTDVPGFGPDGPIDFTDGLDDSIVGADLNDLGAGLDLGSAFDLTEMEF
jgi:mediator of RNA polymerase II transcription subunit 5